MQIPNIKVFTDASNIQEIRGYAGEEWISGFTTNPTLLRKGGVTHYRSFAEEALQVIGIKSLSLEVVADDIPTMTKQGLILGSWGKNVVVKIPISTTAGVSCTAVVRTLLDEGIAVNVTAIMTDEQVDGVLGLVRPTDSVILSVFAGRIADTGVDPVSLMVRYAARVKQVQGAELLWASPREVLNVVQAAESGCDIITVTPDLLRKMELLGKNLGEFSRETVRMFYDDALSAGLEISQD